MTKKLLVGLALGYGAYKLYTSRRPAAAKPVAPPVRETESIPTMTALPAVDDLPANPPARSVKGARKQRTTAPRRVRRKRKS